MSVADHDLIVIGGGPAGEKGAAQAAYFGKRVALVDADQELPSFRTRRGLTRNQRERIGSVR